MKARLGWIAIVMALVVTATAVWLLSSNPQPQNGPAQGGQIARGKVVYQEQCARCHGLNLEGQADWKTRKPDGRLPAPPHDQSGHTWHHTDDQLFAITKFGLGPPMAPEGYESDMPAFEGILHDADIRAVLAYIGSTWPEVIRGRR